MSISARASSVLLTTTAMMISSIAPCLSQNATASASSPSSSMSGAGVTGTASGSGVNGSNPSAANVTGGPTNGGNLSTVNGGTPTNGGGFHFLQGAARTSQFGAMQYGSGSAPPAQVSVADKPMSVRKSSKERGDMLLFGKGSGYERTTMIPADYLEATGVLNPADRESYTPEFQAEMRMQMNGKQILGPMSILHTGAGYMDQSILTSQEVSVDGIPHRVSGSLVLEAPGWDDKMALRNARERQNREIAARRASQNRQIAGRQQVPVRSVAARTAPNWY